MENPLAHEDLPPVRGIELSLNVGDGRDQASQARRVNFGARIGFISVAAHQGGIARAMRKPALIWQKRPSNVDLISRCFIRPAKAHPRAADGNRASAARGAASEFFQSPADLIPRTSQARGRLAASGAQ
jgi:hypothetical protein